jgi:ankyrin repeat protein
MKTTGDNLPSKSNEEQFLDYCRSDQFEKAMEFLYLLPNKQDFNYKYRDPATGKSYLHYAVEKDNAEMLSFFIAKCDKDGRDNQGNTALNLACQQGKTEIANLLINAKADVNIPNTHGAYPLHYTHDQSLLESLLKQKANINAYDNLGSSALHWAAWKGSKDIVDLLLRKGANISAQDIYGNTPLHSAAWTGSKDIVDLLHEKGADTNAKNAEGNTPLHFACKAKKWEAVEDLLANNKYKIDVTIQDNFGNSPLLEAVKDSNALNTLKLLLQRAPSQDMQGALAKAMYINNQPAIDILLQRALQQNDRHPLNNYSIISLNGYDYNIIQDVNGKAMSAFDPIMSSANTLKNNGVKIDVVNFNKFSEEEQKIFDAGDLKRMLEYKISNSSEKKIIMLDLYHGNKTPTILENGKRKDEHTVQITKYLTINTADYISMCQEIAKQHGKEVIHVNMSCLGGHALTENLKDKDRQNGVNALSFSSTDAPVFTEYGVGLLSSLICDTKFKSANQQELLFKMFAQEFSEKTAINAKQNHLTLAKVNVQGTDYEPHTLSSVLVVNGKTIDSWENLKEKAGKEVTAPEKERVHKLLDGTWPKDKINAAFASLKWLKPHELETFYQSKDENYYDLKLLQIVAAAVEFNKQYPAPEVTVYNKIARSEADLNRPTPDSNAKCTKIIEDYFSPSNLESLRSLTKSNVPPNKTLLQQRGMNKSNPRPFGKC